VQRINKLEIKTKVKTVKPIAENSDFGFNYSEFNVVQDTIKGDNFGTIISEQNIGDRKVFEIVKVLEILLTLGTSGNRLIRLRSKDKTNKLQVFVYQPDALSYYVFDFRDTTVVAYKKRDRLPLEDELLAALLKVRYLKP
jgi:hypothetical protein